MLLSAGWYWRPIDCSVLLPIPLASGEYVYVNHEGRVAFPNRWTMAWEFDERGLAQVIVNSQIDWIDRSGNISSKGGKPTKLTTQEIREIHYSEMFPKQNVRDALPEFDRLRAPQKTGPWGEVDADDRLFVVPQWEGVEKTVTLARVLQRDRWGYMDRNNQWVIPPQWTYVEDFDVDGMARVEFRGKSGFIDRTGKTVIPLDWDSAENFDRKGLSCVSHLGSYGFINRTHQLLTPLNWSSARGFDGYSLAPVMRDGLWGCVNRKGQEVIPCRWTQFKSVTDLEQRFFLFDEVNHEQPDWIWRANDWSARFFNRQLFSSQRWFLYDSHGTRMWNSAWSMSSWAPIIMAIAGLWLMIDLRRWKRSYRTSSGSSISSLNQASD